MVQPLGCTLVIWFSRYAIASPAATMSGLLSPLMSATNRLLQLTTGVRRRTIGLICEKKVERESRVWSDLGAEMAASGIV